MNSETRKKKGQSSKWRNRWRSGLLSEREFAVEKWEIKTLGLPTRSSVTEQKLGCSTGGLVQI